MCMQYQLKLTVKSRVSLKDLKGLRSVIKLRCASKLVSGAGVVSLTHSKDSAAQYASLTKLEEGR
jgi:hypothetical protein